MKTIRALQKSLCVTIICFLGSSSLALAEGLKCHLGSDYGDYPPHVKIEKDLNNDKIPDIFYLAGSEDVFQTCVFLGKKSKSKNRFDLAHSHSKFYDSVLDLDGSGKAQILVPSAVMACEKVGEDSSS